MRRMWEWGGMGVQLWKPADPAEVWAPHSAWRGPRGPGPAPAPDEGGGKEEQTRLSLLLF